ncbi:hypothetical protein UFOVP728_6 [uncultured Caudovirales phage]|uniref:Uncharacterized protein n=1 Tax=uncultured Caudovirales phage TaxID=2100421 RepID=A0A6J5NUF4_9CAUD|nr:hypothetical protein UFOVP728_6 [uncultured Caudovirales phage]
MTTAVPNSMLAFDGGSAFRNKIINGCGWIDQRSNNSAVTVSSTANTFGPDRWAGFGQATDGVFTLVGTKGFFDSAGKGMPSSVYAQTTTPDSAIGTTQAYGIRYCIEGQDIAPWRVGTAQAALATLSFRAYSTKAGTHCVSLQNSAGTRSYVATYSIPVAGAWTQVVIPIQMDATGTWLTDNGIGIRLVWNMGSGANFLTATPNTWVAGQFYSILAAQNVIDTASAILAVTDVQLELGGPSTFELRSISQELEMCQRYYETGRQPYFYANFAAGLNVGYGDVRFAVAKRAAPSAVVATGWQYFSGGSGTAFTPTINTLLVDGFQFQATGLTNWSGWGGNGTWAANAEL